MKMTTHCTDCTYPTTPTMWEDTEEQAVDEGIEDARIEKMMNSEAMAFEEDKKEEIHAARKKALAFGLIDWFTNSVRISVMQPTTFMDKHPKGAMNLESTRYDFSLKTPNDVSKQDMQKYMNWLCR